jgi:hypothetical protein
MGRPQGDFSPEYAPAVSVVQAGLILIIKMMLGFVHSKI